MSNFVEYGDKIAFHPGCYVKELVEVSGLTQEDFAKRLDTTPKNLSLLIRGEQSLSFDIAVKLSRMLGTSVNYWLNLQNAYDSLIAEFDLEKELELEKEVLSKLGYGYLRDNFELPDLPRKIKEQVKETREFLKISSLTILSKNDFMVSFRSDSKNLSESNTIKANVMVQIAINNAVNIEAPKFDKVEFEKAYHYALTLTKNHDDFYPLVKESFRKTGVILEVLPNVPGSNINGATKKIGKNILLMVNNRRLYADVFWFTLFHEIGHVMNGDFGISLNNESGEKEELADKFAREMLIPENRYQQFKTMGEFDLNSIKEFAISIERDPGIVIGRLQKDGLINYNASFEKLRHKYKVVNS